MRLSTYQVVGICVSFLFFFNAIIPIIQNADNERVTLRGVVEGSARYNDMIWERYDNYRNSCTPIGYDRGYDLRLCYPPKKILKENYTMKITYEIFKDDRHSRNSKWPGQYLNDITINHPILKENEIFVLLEAVMAFFGLPFYIAGFTYILCKKGFVARYNADIVAMFALAAGEFSFFLIFSDYKIIEMMVSLHIVPIVLSILYAFYIGFLGWRSLKEEPLKFDAKASKNIDRFFMFCGITLPIFILWLASLHTSVIPNYELETFFLIFIAILFQIIQLIFNLFFIISKSNEGEIQNK